eukprot:218903-Lingulodinium_polyedra.AAC.1
MDKSLAKQCPSISGMLQNMIKMKAIGPALQPQAFQGKHYAEAAGDMQTIKKDFDVCGMFNS